jgi:hypothetical protein
MIKLSFPVPVDRLDELKNLSRSKYGHYILFIVNEQLGTERVVIQFDCDHGFACFVEHWFSLDD